MPNFQPIGGTDVAALVGLHPYKSPFQVYLRCRGEEPPRPDSRAMRLGRKWETVLLEEYGIELQVPVRHNTERMSHPTRAYQGGTPDGWQVKKKGKLLVPTGVGVEAKTANIRQAHRWGDPGSDDIPEEYLCQALWYASLEDFPTWDVVVLLGGGDFRIYRVARDRELEGLLLEEAERFWKDHVVPGVPPPFDGTGSAREWLEARYPKPTTDAYVVATEMHEPMLSLLRRRWLAKQKVEELYEKTATAVMSIIGESSGIEYSGGKISYKLPKPSSVVDWEKIARELAGGSIPADLIKKYSREKKQSRRFDTGFRKERDDE